MRARNIKPGFFKNEDLAEDGPLAMIAFAGLWGIADREGRLEDRPKRIKAEIVPYFDCNMDEILDSLSPEFIVRYSVNGNNYIQIIEFHKHQNPHKNEAKSVIPEMSSTSTLQAPEKHRTNPADSLIPDSLIPDTPPNPPRGEVAEGKLGAVAKVELEQDFVEWKKVYPNKQGSSKALEYYLRRRVSGQTKADLLLGRDRYLAMKKLEGSNTFANCSTFLNPKPRGDSANIDDNVGDSYQPPPPTCGTCKRGGPNGNYCMKRQGDVGPGDKPCDDYEEAPVG